MEKENIKIRCVEAINKINIALSKKDSSEYALSESMLLNIKIEVEIMLQKMNKDEYSPSYPKFLLDYPITELIDYLIETAYLYKRKT